MERTEQVNCVVIDSNPLNCKAVPSVARRQKAATRISSAAKSIAMRKRQGEKGAFRISV